MKYTLSISVPKCSRLALSSLLVSLPLSLSSPRLISLHIPYSCSLEDQHHPIHFLPNHPPVRLSSALIHHFYHPTISTMESFATAAPSQVQENTRPRTAMASFGRSSAFRLPRHIRFTPEFVAMLEMRATLTTTTPCYQVSTLVPEDLSLIAEFFALFLKLASLSHIFSDPHCAQLEVPAPTLSILLMYLCLLDETIACALRIEIIAKVRGSVDYVVSEISSHHG